MAETIIKFEHVKKEYRLGQIGGGTLKGDIQSWFARIRGKDDPNSLIGSGNKNIKTGERFLALNDISFEVEKGEALGIIGHNGAGKSTLLKLLSRVTAPSDGTVSYNGRIASMLEVGTGFHPEMTGRENIYMNGAILGMTKAEIDAKMEDIIEFSEVRDFIDTPVKRYSSGMFVKLAFAVAAHLDSEIMIMDEVLAVGDMAFQKKCLTKMREAAKQEGRTVLYVSHNMNTIRQLCDRCIVLDHGKVIFDGEVNEAISIYLDVDEEVSNKSDLSKQTRVSYLPKDKTILLKYCEYLENDNMYNQNILRLMLKWDKYKDDNVFFRFEFSCNGSGVAAAKTQNTIAASKESCFLGIDISPLVPDTYDVILVAYKEIDNHSYDLDVVKLPKYKKTFDDHSFVNWNKSNWGYIKLPEIRCEP